MVRTWRFSLLRAWFQSLVREQRSHKLCRVAKKKKNPKTHSSKLASPCAEPTVMMTDVCLAAPQTAQGLGVSLDPDSLRENLGTGALNSQVHSGPSNNVTLSCSGPLLCK